MHTERWFALTNLQTVLNSSSCFRCCWGQQFTDKLMVTAARSWLGVWLPIHPRIKLKPKPMKLVCYVVRLLSQLDSKHSDEGMENPRDCKKVKLPVIMHI